MENTHAKRKERMVLHSQWRSLWRRLCNEKHSPCSRQRIQRRRTKSSVKSLKSNNSEIWYRYWRIPKPDTRSVTALTAFASGSSWCLCHAATASAPLAAKVSSRSPRSRKASSCSMKSKLIIWLSKSLLSAPNATSFTWLMKNCLLNLKKSLELMLSKNELRKGMKSSCRIYIST